MASVTERQNNTLLRDTVTEALRSLAESVSKLERVAKGQAASKAAEKDSSRVARTKE